MAAVGAAGEILRPGVDQSLTPRCAPAPPFGAGASNSPDQRYYSGNTITTDRGATSHGNVLKQAARKRQNAPSMLPRAVSRGQSSWPSDVQWSHLEKWNGGVRVCGVQVASGTHTHTHTRHLHPAPFSSALLKEAEQHTVNSA